MNWFWYLLALVPIPWEVLAFIGVVALIILAFKWAEGSSAYSDE